MKYKNITSVIIINIYILILIKKKYNVTNAASDISIIIIILSMN